jgi:glycosyltransferase involved in cell wall biosynthesis
LDEINETFKIGRKEQFVIIPLGIDMGPFLGPEKPREEFRASLGARDNEFVVGFVGRLTEIKNVPLLLDAAKELQSNGTDEKVEYKFLIVGEGNMRPALEEQVKEKDLLLINK